MDGHDAPSPAISPAVDSTVVRRAEIAAIGAEPGALVGLALSGGGVRSASFNLGVLHALARAQLLSRVDFLSTVSGGGYIGGWLVTWLARRIQESARAGEALAPRSADADGGDGCRLAFDRVLQDVETELAKPADALPVRNVRDYGNFLTPRRGVLSLDTWSWASLYMANLLINLVSLMTWVVAAICIVWLYLAAWVVIGTVQCQPLTGALARAVICKREWWSLALVTGSLYALGVQFAWSAPRSESSESHRAAQQKGPYPWLPLWLGMSAAICVSTWFPSIARANLNASTMAIVVIAALAPALAWTYGLRLGESRRISEQPEPPAGEPRPTPYRAGFETTRWMFVAVLATMAMLYGVAVLWTSMNWLSVVARAPLKWQVVVGPPVVTAVAALGFTVHLVLVRDRFNASQHDWWARQAAANFQVMTGYTALLALVYISPRLADPRRNGLSIGWIEMWLAGLVIVFGIVGAGRVVQRRRPNLGSRIATVGAVLAVIGILVLAVAGAMRLQQLLTSVIFADLSQSLKNGGMGSSFLYDRVPAIGDRAGVQVVATLAMLFVALAFAGALSRGTINLFSLHSAYRLRITRAFLGASSAVAVAGAVGHSDAAPAADDDIVLHKLVYTNHRGERRAPRPYPIVTTALNLSGARDLGWRQRRATSFLFSPLYCGYELRMSGQNSPKSCFRQTEHYMSSKGGLFLGTALAISGAATSPNMGLRTSAITAFLMTIANVRLGRWCPNPGGGKAAEVNPSNDLMYFGRELLGRANLDSEFVYLSDGGHFENTGIYELVRRRCRLIIAVDCGADPKYEFADIVRLVRRCRVDFGTEIDIGLDPLRPDASLARSAQSLVIGRIVYPDADTDGPAHDNVVRDGTLILIKPTLVERLPDEVAAYLGFERNFPQVATSDQWFDETQFECYRVLGRWLTENALRRDDVRSALRDAIGFDAD